MGNSRKWKTSMIIISVVLLLTTVLAACSEKKTTAPEKTAKMSIVSFPGLSISAHSKAIISEQGLDAKNNWKLDWQIRPTTDAYYNDFINGVYDSIDYGGLNVFASLYNKGVPLQVVQGSLTYPFPLVVKAESGIKNIQDLKGKKVGVTRSSYAYAYLNVIAKKAGLNLEKDFQVVNVDFFQAPNLLKRGDIDAGMLLFESAIQLSDEATDQFHIVFDGTKEFAKALGVEKVYTMHAIRTDWIKKNPDAMGNILSTYKELGEFISKNPDETVKTLSKKFDNGVHVPESVAKKEYVSGLNGMKSQWMSKPIGDIPAEDLQKELEAYMEAGLIDKIPDKGFFYSK